MKHKDILLIARPDHSILIYNELCQQDEVTFDYLTFKVVPSWLKSILLNWKRLQSVGKNAVISLKCSVVNILKFKFRFRFAQDWPEENIMGNSVKHLLEKNCYKIIHYWPLYVFTEVESWSKNHPDAVVLADVHFPNPDVVIKEMMPVYEKYGLDFSNTEWPRHLSNTKKILDGAPAMLAPSEYVAETYRESYPHKRIYVVSYGISVSKEYRKLYRNQIKTFVFAGGTISLEKGCDLLCEYFCMHPEITLHLYGNIPCAQEFIFDKYKSKKNINFHGHIAKSDLQGKIKEYDVGIHLSRFDAYSLSVGEIIGCGLPVVVSNKTGISSEVKQYGLGIVTNLSYSAIHEAITNIRTLEMYNKVVDNIDEYIRTEHIDFGEKMLDFYKRFC